MVFRPGALYIYADGCSLQSPRRGGIGVRLINEDADGEERLQDIQLPGYKNATNNQMELKACIIGLEEAIRLHLTTGLSRIIIRTDSGYVVDNYKRAVYQWSSNRWNKRSGAPVLNAELWRGLLKAMKSVGVRVDIEWVRGHSKDEHNRAVDRMARQSARMATDSALSIVHVRRKLSEESVQPGSVPLQGQRLSIRIITGEYLEMHKTWRCKYEVMSKTSDHYMKVDFVYCEHLLEAGHSYYVQVCSDTRNPRVVKVFREIQEKRKS